MRTACRELWFHVLWEQTKSTCSDKFAMKCKSGFTSSGMHLPRWEEAGFNYCFLIEVLCKCGFVRFFERTSRHLRKDFEMLFWGDSIRKLAKRWTCVHNSQPVSLFWGKLNKNYIIKSFPTSSCWDCLRVAASPKMGSKVCGTGVLPGRKHSPGDTATEWRGEGRTGQGRAGDVFQACFQVHGGLWHSSAFCCSLSKRVMWTSDGTGSVQSVPSEFLFHSTNVSWKGFQTAPGTSFKWCRREYASKTGCKFR